MRLVLQTLLVEAAIAFIAMMFTTPELAFGQKVDPWEKTKLNESHLRALLSQKQCYRSENLFLGCISAVNSLLKVGQPAKALTNTNIQTLPEMGHIIAEIENLKIQEHLTDKTPLDLQSIETKKREIEIINRSWRTVYNFTKTNQISFEKLFDKAFDYNNGNFKSAKVANALNEYYKQAIDPHTYIVADLAQTQNIGATEKVVVGIGAELRPLAKTIIITPFHGSAAQQAGLKPYDILLEVNGESVIDKSTEEAKQMIVGEENTPVVIKIARDGETKTFEILRRKFVQKNFQIQFLNDSITKEKIAYISIQSFMDSEACRLFIRYAQIAKAKGAKALVLDLRNNYGGLAHQARCIMQTYLEKGSVMYTENDPATNKVKQTFKDEDPAYVYDLFGKKPLVVLLNANSASASEMLAGGLRVHGRAIIVGDRSFGKGTYQQPVSYLMHGTTDTNGLTLMQTQGRFHFANGESNQLVGLTPDIQIMAKNEPLYMREADLYPNAITSIISKPYVPSAKIGKIKSCITRRGMLGSDYAARLNRHLVPNQQLEVAREAASCL